MLKKHCSNDRGKNEQDHSLGNSEIGSRDQTQEPIV